MSEIRAIETRYKGYRFRSRLEARWAVFFDALGIQWEYEPQGYDVNGRRYLPDFYLPESKTIVEIKPMVGSPEKRLSVYLAGKITRGDWRTALVPGLIGTDPGYSGEPLSMTCGHAYAGPFFSSLGHGADHCRDAGALHGIAGEQASHDGGGGQAEEIATRCLSQIDGADVLFAWSDGDYSTAYGTLVEIGYAKARGKVVWIAQSSEATSEDGGEAWFAFQLADERCVASSPTAALNQLLPPDDEPTSLLSALARDRHEPAMLIRGTPDPKGNDYRASEFLAYGGAKRAGTLGLVRGRLRVLHAGWSYNETRRQVEDALSAARSARFEHGETPR